MRNLSTGSAVLYVAAPANEGGKSSVKKASIAEVITAGSARLELGPNEHALAEYSANGEAGTFHFPDEAKDVKKSDAFGEAPAPALAAAVNGSKAKA